MVPEEKKMKYSRFLIAFSVLVLSATLPVSAKETHATIVYDDVATEIASARQESGQLWVTTADLTRATKFELKPQGACRDELCFPIPKGRTAEFENTAGGKKFFNLTAFAALVKQPVAHDEALDTWYFGLRSDQRETLSSLQAPDFTLRDMQGNLHSLSDFHGKKVLLVTWASW
jgi:hypothetical protein